ncbi:MAG: hypothetical protein U5K28_07995 [Halobacteriales archaeon]|nr:hypothetical protein [Halobacteriales archaeon]
MVETNPNESLDAHDRAARGTDAVKDAWQRTIEDTRAMAADREEAGYETLVLFADDTAPAIPAHGDDDDDSWGFSYLVPQSDREAFTEFVADAAFDETGVYQATEQGDVFMVVECIDLDAERVLFIASAYKMRTAVELVRTAMDRDEMYTHVRDLEGNIVGTIHHDDPEGFFPNPDDYYAFDPTELNQMPGSMPGRDSDDDAVDADESDEVDDTTADDTSPDDA